ncbi:hypothetical protein IAU60_004788 [Kwoniella sp. DSM 27419]
MNDPLSPLTAPPPRYLLESDSSDEEGQGTYPGSGPSSSRPKIRQAQTIDDPAVAGGAVSHVVLGIGQAGRYLLKHVQAQTPATGEAIKVDGSEVGSIRTVGGIRLVIIEENGLKGETVWDLASALTEAVQAEQWTIITSYVPAMYIPSTSELSQRGSRASSNIRVFSSGPASTSVPNDAASFDPPNYLTGLAAALVSLAAHPSAEVAPPQTILLPLPLSSVPIAYLTSILQPSGNLADLVASLVTPSLGGKRSSRWTEDDDEPYSAPGMGRKSHHAGLGEVSSMYM